MHTPVAPKTGVTLTSPHLVPVGKVVVSSHRTMFFSAIAWRYFVQHEGERRLRDHLMYEFPDHLRRW